MDISKPRETSANISYKTAGGISHNLQWVIELPPYSELPKRHDAREIDANFHSGRLTYRVGIVHLKHHRDSADCNSLPPPFGVESHLNTFPVAALRLPPAIVCKPSGLQRRLHERRFRCGKTPAFRNQLTKRTSVTPNGVPENSRW